MYRDREDAGRRLAQSLSRFVQRGNLLVLAIPRGGVEVGYYVAEALRAPLDVIVPRKIGAPHEPELAIGAIVAPEIYFVDEQALAYYRIPRSYLEEQMSRLLAEIERRYLEYRGEPRPPELSGKSVVLVDDGIATGFTMRAAVEALRQREPSAITIAVPVAPPETVAELKRAAPVVCPFQPTPFWAVGSWYQEFPQLGDEQVKALLEKAKIWAEEVK